MDKLIIPQDCVIQGNMNAITNQGDIHLANGITPQRLESLEGSIRIAAITQQANSESIIAPQGSVELFGQQLKTNQLLAKNVTMELEDLEAQSVQATTGDTKFLGHKLHIEQLSSDSVEIEAETVQIGLLRATGTVRIKADQIKIEEIEATAIHVEGRFECGKVSASEGLTVEKGHVAIKNLDSPSFSSGEGVGGIVMIATCEKVQTQGVRGFLRPSEIGMFSNGGSTMDLAQILGVSGASASRPFGDASAMPPAEVNTPEPQEVADSATDEEDTQPEEESSAVETPPETSAEMPVDEPEAEIVTVEQEAGEAVEPVQEPETPELTPEPSEEPELEVADSLTQNISSGDLSLRTTVVVGGPEEDDGEMKTIQLNPEQLQDAIKNQNPSLQTFSSEAQTELENDYQMDPELNDVLTEDDVMEMEDHVSLPEIQGFDDYQTTDELDEEVAAEIDASSTDVSMAGLEMPEETEDLWEEESEPELEVEDVATDIEVEELSEDDFYSVDDSQFTELAVEEEPAAEESQQEVLSEDDLRKSLTQTLDQIREYFPDENYPKFIYQIQNYVNEGRFNILAKARNRDAVLSSFEKLNHPEISKLSSEFYGTLADYFQDTDLSL